MRRQRRRIVPREAVECFEIRLAMYFTEDGDAIVGFEISTPDDLDARPPIHEVLGVLRFGEAVIMEDYDQIEQQE
jgi:hypothetical protein